MSEALSYLAGLLTLPAIGVAIIFAQWAFSRTRGIGPCIVEGCGNKVMKLGEHYNIAVWINGVSHKLTGGPRHRKVVLAYWQARKDQGLAIHPRVGHKLK